eukprot:5802697-Pyramimonas_sp.AAC.1
MCIRDSHMFALGGLRTKRPQLLRVRLLARCEVQVEGDSNDVGGGLQQSWRRPPAPESTAAKSSPARTREAGSQ